MNISGVLAAIGRRWYLALVVIGVTIYVAMGLWDAAVPEYHSSVTVSVVRSPGLVAAQQSQDPLLVLTNPYSSETTLASLLADTVSFGGIALPATAKDTVLEVGTNAIRPESFFAIDARGPSAEAVLAAMQAVQDQTPTVIADVQQRAGATPDQLYTAVLSRDPTTPDASYPSRARAVLGVGLAGALVTALLCVLLDGAVRASRAARARRRRTAADRTVADGHAGQAPRVEDHASTPAPPAVAADAPPVEPGGLGVGAQEWPMSRREIRSSDQH